MKTFRVAVIAGDGIGKEVVPEGMRVLEAAGKRFGFAWEWKEFDWSCESYTKTGMMMPADGLAQWKPGETDFTIVRENCEGEYSNVGGRVYQGRDDEMAVQHAIFTRRGVERVMRYAFDLARKSKKHLTSATKSNGIIYTMPFWDEW